MSRMRENPEVLILRMRHVLFIDATGIYRLKEVIKKFKEENTAVILSGVNERVLADLEKGDIYSVLSAKHLTENIDNASERASQIIAEKGL